MYVGQSDRIWVGGLAIALEWQQLLLALASLAMNQRSQELSHRERERWNITRDETFLN